MINIQIILDKEMTGTECIICFKYIKNTTNVCKTFNVFGCKHLFHSDCILQYMTTQFKSNVWTFKCPLCRKKSTLERKRFFIFKMYWDCILKKHFKQKLSFEEHQKIKTKLKNIKEIKKTLYYAW